MNGLPDARTAAACVASVLRFLSVLRSDTPVLDSASCQKRSSYFFLPFHAAPSCVMPCARLPPLCGRRVRRSLHAWYAGSFARCSLRGAVTATGPTCRSLIRMLPAHDPLERPRLISCEQNQDTACACGNLEGSVGSRIGGSDW